ncbi:hypothetical protein RND81_14G171700 [Saponaria officinalis]|uniref:KIB1-4 beta-propeller domain-containing protein n=1 Tax=Saponaria officinalis TaxID=3572 RepID=A0AAW1GN58_SAPOF
MRIKGHSGRSNATFLSPILPQNSHFSDQFDDEPAFTRRRHWNILTTTVFSLSSSTSTATPWPYAAVDGADADEQQFLHPLTLKPHNFPKNFNLHNFEINTLTSFHHTNISFDKLVIPPPSSGILSDDTMLVLYSGGKLFGRFPLVAEEKSPEWVTFSDELFDDIVVFKARAYAVDRLGKLYVINNNVKSRRLYLGKTLINRQITPWQGGVGWRKRLVADERDLYVVVREVEKLFRVFKFIRRLKSSYWIEVKGFDDGRVLFVSKDCCFFMDGFGGREYENCIVFSESSFPEYRMSGCWEYNCGDGIRVFRFSDGNFGRVGGSVGFPKIDWSPPSWVFDVGSCMSSPSRAQSEREPDEDEGLDSNGKGETSDLKHSNIGDEEQDEEKHSNSGDEEEHEVMELDLDSQDDQEQDERGSDPDIQDQDDGILQCDSDSQENQDEEMHSDDNIEGDASLQEDVPPSLFASVSSDEEEVTRTILPVNDVNEAVEKESSRENIAPSESNCCTSSTSKSCEGDSTTTKFEGFDIRSDLVPALQKIWRNHGNITENSTMRSGDIIASALESLATMVQILKNNSVESLSDCQADYLSSTLSDLQCMRFRVHWLTSFVEKAVKLHKSKALVDSLNNQSQLRSQVKERKAVLLDEIAKLMKEENKLMAEMAKVSKLIPFSWQVKLDEPLGSGLT